jgi:predicted regulator of Ras-like GTPase activity (Roadblock/LC7/MglB family)
MNYILNQDSIDQIEQTLTNELVSIGVSSVFLSDMAGNVIASADNGTVTHDIYALAALSVANFGATNEIARLIGEQDFTLLFHKGDHESIHFSRVGEHFLLCSIFGEKTSLGFVRLRVAEITGKVQSLIENTIILTSERVENGRKSRT